MTQVYILEKKDATQPETEWEIHLWTESLLVAQRWRLSSTRDERRDFRDLYFIKKVNTVEEMEDILR